MKSHQNAFALFIKVLNMQITQKRSSIFHRYIGKESTHTHRNKQKALQASTRICYTQNYIHFISYIHILRQKKYFYQKTHRTKSLLLQSIIIRGRLGYKAN